MAEDRKTPSSVKQEAAPAAPAPAAFTPEQLTQAVMALAQMAGGQQAFMEFMKGNTPKRRKTLDEYLREKPRKYLHREVYQNNSLVNPKGLAQKTLDTLDTLATGDYTPGDGGVTFHVVRVGAGKFSRINIFYDNKSLEQRMALYMRYPKFTDIVNAIAAEMAVKGIEPVLEERPDPPDWAKVEEVETPVEVSKTFLPTVG